MAAQEALIRLTAKDETGQAFGTAKASLQALGQQASTLQDTFASAAVRFGTIGAAISTAFAGASLKEAVDLGDRLDDLSEKTGILVADLSALRYAGEVVGTPLESIATGVKKLSINMAAAAGGAKEQAEIFKTLGISVKDLDGSLKGSDKVLGELADKFAGFKDGPAKAALAIKVFGKAGEELIPLLNQGSKGIKALREEAERLGVVIGSEFAGQAATFNDNLKKISLSTEANKNVIAGQLLPTLNSLAESFLSTKDGASSFAETLGKGLRIALEAVVILGSDVAFVFKGIGRDLGGIAAQMVALSTLDFKGFSSIGQAMREDATAARKELDAFQKRLLNAGNRYEGTAKQLEREFNLGGSGKKDTPIPDKTPGGSEISTYDRINDSIAKRIALAKEEQVTNDKLTAGRRQELETVADINAALKQGKLTIAESAVLMGKAQDARVLQDANVERQKAIKFQTDYNKALELGAQAEFDKGANVLLGIQEKIRETEDEVKALDLATAANISLAEAVERVAIARLSEKEAKAKALGNDTEVDEISGELALRQQRSKQLSNAFIRSIQDQVRASRDEYEANELAARSNITVAEAVQRVTIARLQDQAAQLKGNAARAGELAGINDQIQARKELADQLGRLSVQGLRDQVRATEEEFQASELATRANIGHAEALQRVTLARLQATLAQRQANGDSEKDLELLKAQISATSSLANALNKTETQSQIQQSADQFQDVFRTAFRDVFLQNDDVFKTFGKSLKATLATSLADAIYSATVKQAVGEFSTFLASSLRGLAGGGSSQGGSADGGGLSGIGSSVLGKVGTSALGSALGSSLTGTLGGTFGAGVVGGFQAGAVGGTELAAVLASNGALAGSLGAMVGALGPYAIAAYAIYSLLTSGHGETRSGGRYSDTTFLEGPSGGEIGGDAVRLAIAASSMSINSMLGALGSSAKLGTLQSGLESSEKGKGYAYAGGTLSTGVNFGQYNPTIGIQNRRGDLTTEQANAAFGEELKQATLQALQAADVPGILGDYLKQLGDVDALSGGALDAALGRINTALTQKATLEARLFEATSTEAQKLTKARNDERAAIDASNKSLLESVYVREDQLKSVASARNVLSDAYENEKRTLETTRDKVMGLGKTLKSFTDGLLVGSLSPLTPGERYAELGSRYSILKAQASSGNADAVEKFPEIAQQFLEASRIYNASGANYQADFARVLADSEGMQSIASKQYDASVAALSRLDLQVAGLIDIKGAVLSVKDAIVALAGVPGAATIDPIVKLYQELLKRAPDAEGGAYFRGQLAVGITEAEIRASIMNSPEYKRMNGIPLASGMDRIPYDGFRATLHADETVLNRDAAQAWRNGMNGGNDAAIAAELAALRKEVAELRKENRADAFAVAQSHAVAVEKSADKIVSGTAGNVQAAAWRANNVPAIA